MMENVYELRKKIFDGLELQASVIETQGQRLDIGERFKVRFTVTHKLFDPATGWFLGTVRFVDCKLHLEPTPFAKPVPASPVLIPLGTLSSVGQSLQTIVEFEATAKLPSISIPGRVSVDPPEPYVKARVEARFDIQAFFNFWQDKVFMTQIEAG